MLKIFYCCIVCKIFFWQFITYHYLQCQSYSADTNGVKLDFDCYWWMVVKYYNLKIEILQL